ncbi:MAG: class I SAM-dependent methyltransferase, partial [Deltaproteobacteria bacterium]|nr:class I SAM-dependent methyltransferase [Deltaproteobacteria bacterium]
MKPIEPCMICGSYAFRGIHQNGPWRYLRCRGCGLVTIHPRPSPEFLRERYDRYLSETPEDIEQWREMMRPVVLRSADLIRKRVRTTGRRLLDIGSGYGFFLAEMKNRGWRVEGIEISRPGREYARHALGLTVHSRPLEVMEFPRERFDVITLFYVIEHVPEPAALLKHAFRILRPGGMILLRWPHSTPIVRVLGPMATLFDIYHTPYHLYDFSPSVMTKLLSLAGFEDPETRIGGHTLPQETL